MRKLIPFLVAAALLIPSTVGAQTTAYYIYISPSGFSPNTLTVTEGSIITWINRSESYQTASAGAFDSGIIVPGSSFMMFMNTPGNYQVRSRYSGIAGAISVSPRTLAGASPGYYPSQNYQYSAPNYSTPNYYSSPNYGYTSPAYYPPSYNPAPNYYQNYSYPYPGSYSNYSQPSYYGTSYYSAGGYQNYGYPYTSRNWSSPMYGGYSPGYFYPF